MILSLAHLALAADHHVVRPGDTLSAIASSRGLSVEALRVANGLAPTATPEAGTVLLVPGAPDHGRGAVCVALTGTARALPPGGAEVPLAAGASVTAGTTVCTDADSFLTLRLPTARAGGAHDEISLVARTCLTLDASSVGADRSSLVTVTRGEVSVRAAEGDDAATVTVRTPSGVTTGERGGFRVTAEEGAARTEALHAPVEVLGGGVRRDLDAGYGSRTRTGEAPGEPVALPPPGDPERPGHGETLLRPDFAWAPAARALGYRIELAASADFSRVLLVEEVSTPSWQPEALLLPFRVPGIWWRVSSFDRTGFLGVPSAARPVAFPPGVGP
ncbi:MAG: LysM peptidoglycan-binding domain-containing protein [Myxococcota bacterium]